MEEVKTVAIHLSAVAIYNPVFNYVGDNTPGFKPSALELAQFKAGDVATNALNLLASATHGSLGADAAQCQQLKLAGVKAMITSGLFYQPIPRRAQANLVFGLSAMTVMGWLKPLIGKRLSAFCRHSVLLINVLPAGGVLAYQTYHERLSK